MCASSLIKDYYRRYNEDRIVQGDILRDVKFRDWDWDDNKHDIIIYEKDLPYIVILTQDCDLEWDFKYRTTTQKNDDKKLQSVLVCPAYGWEKFIQGEHLKKFELTMETIHSDKRKLIKKQQVSRFHYLEEDVKDQIPALVIDFKHYYTLPIGFLRHIYKNHYAYSMNELFRECLSQRFSFYLSRIGLPEIK